MCYQRAKAWVLWFAPTKTQVAILAGLILVAMMLGGAAERRRRNAVMRAMAEQAQVLSDRLQSEIDSAVGVHNELQRQIDRVNERVNDLERRRSSNTNH